MAQALREFLGFPERKVSGEVTVRRSDDGKTPTGYRIVLRFGSPISESARPVEADTIDEAVRLAAPAVAEQFDPVGLASFYLRTKKWNEINQLEDKLIGHADPDIRKQGLLLRVGQSSSSAIAGGVPTSSFCIIILLPPSSR